MFLHCSQKAMLISQNNFPQVRSPPIFRRQKLSFEIYELNKTLTQTRDLRTQKVVRVLSILNMGGEQVREIHQS